MTSTQACPVLETIYGLGHGSSGRSPASHLQGTEFKPQYCKKKKKFGIEEQRALMRLILVSVSKPEYRESPVRKLTTIIQVTSGWILLIFLEGPIKICLLNKDVWYMRREELRITIRYWA
jgi:hypothetical protein